MDSCTLRIPRIKGLTNKAKAQNLDKISAHISEYYLRNNFTYLGVDLSIRELSEMTGLGIGQITAQVVEGSGAFSSLLAPDSQAAANKSLTFLYDHVLTWAFKDRYRSDAIYDAVNEQLRYPNGTIKSNMGNLLVRILEQGSRNSTTLIGLIDSLRATSPGGTTNPLNPQSGSAVGPSRALTTQEALNLLQDMAQKALMAPETQDAIYIEEEIGMSPEVRAMGAETAGTKSLKASKHDLVSEEIILDLEVEDLSS